VNRATGALIGAGVLVHVLAPFLSRPLPAQDLKRPEEQLAAIYSLKVQLEVEQLRLDGALQRHVAVARNRISALTRLAALYGELDGMVEGRRESDPDTLSEREAQVRRAEGDLDALSEEGRVVRATINEAHERIRVLQERIARLRRTLPADDESLTGTWEVSFLPSGDKGAFTLRQSGTLLVGEYILDGGWRGSLQGTFVDGKVLLHRIDSKLGRSSDLDGTITPDGRMIKGSWVNLVLSGGSPTTGTWIARKRSDRSEP